MGVVSTDDRTGVNYGNDHIQMKKQSQKAKDKKSPRNGEGASPKNHEAVDKPSKRTGDSETQAKRAPRAAQKSPKKPADTGPGRVGRFIEKAGRFLREAKVELKKVKWPTRKELIASTAVVIVLTLLVAFYLGLVDFGLIKIIRNVVG